MPLDKTALRDRAVKFEMVGDSTDCWVAIQPRSGDRWRVTISDDEQLSEQFVYDADLRADTSNPLELLRLALNGYHAYRSEVAAK